MLQPFHIFAYEPRWRKTCCFSRGMMVFMFIFICLTLHIKGGYCLKSLAESAAMTLRTLLGDPCPAIDSLIEPCQR